jgi:hypothetical protein
VRKGLQEAGLADGIKMRRGPPRVPSPPGFSMGLKCKI